MEGIKLYHYKTVQKLINPRKGEAKFGEKVNYIERIEDLNSHPARYVLFGIPEDIGVRANFGNPGTAGAWHVCLKSLLNTQSNRYTNPENVIRSEEHTSELQSRENLVCRLLLEK